MSFHIPRLFSGTRRQGKAGRNLPRLRRAHTVPLAWSEFQGRKGGIRSYFIGLSFTHCLPHQIAFFWRIMWVKHGKTIIDELFILPIYGDFSGGWFIVLLPSHSFTLVIWQLPQVPGSQNQSLLRSRCSAMETSGFWRTRKTDLWKTNGQKQWTKSIDMSQNWTEYGLDDSRFVVCWGSHICGIKKSFPKGSMWGRVSRLQRTGSTSNAVFSSLRNR